MKFVNLLRPSICYYNNTYQFNKHIRAYFGGENLTGYQQTNPILDAQNPFGNYFDGGMVYAPIMPANLYIGLDVNF